MASLNDKQVRFVGEYLIDLNATQAAIRAGYSAKTAYSSGQRLLKNVEVQRQITAAQARRSERTKIDADWVLTRLAAEAVADLSEIYADDGTLKPVKDWPLIWRQGLIAGVEVDELRVDGVSMGKISKIKLSDRIRRLELIGKHVDVQAFSDKIDHSSKDGSMSPPGLTQFMAALKATK